MNLKEGSQQTTSGRKTVRNTKPGEANNQSSTKSLQLQSTTTSKNTSSITNAKKSLDIRGSGVKESHKKSSFVDKEKTGKSLDKKEGVTRVTDKKQSLTEPKKGSIASKPAGKSAASKNSDVSDNIQSNSKQSSKIDTSNKKSEDVKSGTIKNVVQSSGQAQPTPQKTIEKASSSVSLVRKKFESKIESREGSVVGSGDKKQAASRQMPKVKLSQNRFLKGDTTASAVKKSAENGADMNTNDSYTDDNDDKGQAETTNNANTTVHESESLDFSSSYQPSDKLPVPSPNHDNKHSSDTSRSIDNLHQPIIHPTCQVNEFETDMAESDHEYPAESSPEKPQDCPGQLDMNQPVPRLNIDEVADTADKDMFDDEDNEDDTREPLSPGQRLAPAQLETDLPESPAYR